METLPTAKARIPTLVEVRQHKGDVVEATIQRGLEWSEFKRGLRDMVGDMPLTEKRIDELLQEL